MQTAFRTFNLLLILMICPAFGLGDTTSTQSADESASLPGIETTYDREKNVTTIGFKKLLIRSNETEKVFLNIEAEVPSQTPTTNPADVIFIIQVLNKKGYRYPEINELKITCDGKQLAPVVLLNLDKRSAGPDYLETLGTRMKFSTFMAMVKAGKIEMGFSDLSLSLGDEHRRLLGKLALAFPSLERDKND